MIFVKAYNMIWVTLTFNRIIYLLIEGLQENLISFTTSVLKDLISALANSLGLVSRHCIFNDIFSNCITWERYKLDITNTLKVGFQLRFDECWFSHSRNTNRHDDNDSLLPVTTPAGYFIHELQLLDLRIILDNLWCILGHIIDLDLLLRLALRSLSFLNSPLSIDLLLFLHYYLSASQCRCGLFVGIIVGNSSWLTSLCLGGRCGSLIFIFKNDSWVKP